MWIFDESKVMASFKSRGVFLCTKFQDFLRAKIVIKCRSSLFSSLPHTHRAPSRLPALAQTFRRASRAYLLRKLPPAAARALIYLRFRPSAGILTFLSK